MGALRKKKINLLILSIILLCLVLWISNLLWRENVKRQAVATPQATHILIEQANQAELEFAQHDGQWQMLKPSKQPAITERLEPLLRLVVIPPDSSYASIEVDLNAAGLTEPLARITIDETIILLGQKDNTGNRRYAMQQETVYFVPEWMLSLIQGGPNAFIAAPESQ